MFRLPIAVSLGFAAIVYCAQAAANPVLNFELSAQGKSLSSRPALELKELHAEVWARNMQDGRFMFCPKVKGVAKGIKGDTCMYRARDGGDVVSRTADVVDAQELLDQTLGQGNAFLLGLTPRGTGVGINYTSVPGKDAFNHGYLSAPFYRETPEGFSLCPPEVQGSVIRSIADGSCTYAYRKDGETLEAQAKLVDTSTYLKMSIADDTLEVVGVAVSPGGSSQIGLRHVGTFHPMLVIYYARKSLP